MVKYVGTTLATVKFRVYMAIIASELAQTVLNRARDLRDVGRIALTDPRRLTRAITKRLNVASSMKVQEPVSVERFSTGTPLKHAHVAISSLPIIFIHRSNSDHLKYSLAQAHKSNPHSTIVLLGDPSNDEYDFVEHRQMTDYFHGAAHFQKIYKHYSTHGVDFELICFQRWFILREFLETNGIPQCLYLDSDIMLYADVTKDQKKFEQYDFTLCWNTIGCVFFLSRRKGLDEFCQFLIDVYTQKDKYHYDKMLAHYAVRKKHHLAGGVCDMTAFQLYSEKNFGQVGEASHIIDGSLYDPNINMPNPGFEMENGIKKIVWKNGYPWGTYLRTGETIRFNSLHFNGQAKRLMSQYCTAERNQIEQEKLSVSSPG